MAGKDIAVCRDSYMSACECVCAAAASDNLTRTPYSCMILYDACSCDYAPVGSKMYCCSYSYGKQILSLVLYIIMSVKFLISSGKIIFVTITGLIPKNSFDVGLLF